MEHELEIRDESELKSLTYYEDGQGATEVDNEPGCVHVSMDGGCNAHSGPCHS